MIGLEVSVGSRGRKLLGAHYKEDKDEYLLAATITSSTFRNRLCRECLYIRLPIRLRMRVRIQSKKYNIWAMTLVSAIALLSFIPPVAARINPSSKLF